MAVLYNRKSTPKINHGFSDLHWGLTGRPRLNSHLTESNECNNWTNGIFEFACAAAGIARLVAFWLVVSYNK